MPIARQVLSFLTYKLMKQTNNALKFLLAQYRAIFKHAYVKGLATAAIVTAGLAMAGTAQAAKPATGYDDYKLPSALTPAWGTVGTSPVDVTTPVTDKVYIDSTNAYITNATITGTGAIATESTSGGTLFVGGTLTMDGTDLNLKGTKQASGWAILGYDNSSATTDNSKAEGGTLRLINGATANINAAAIQIGNIEVNGATVTVGGNITKKADPDTWNNNAQLGAAASGAGNNGNLTITNGSEVNINAGGSVYGRTVSIDNSSVTFSGSTATDKTGSAIIYAFVDAIDNANKAATTIDGNIIFDNATVTVAEGAMGGIFGSAGKTNSTTASKDEVNRVNIDVTNSSFTIEDGGKLQMGLLTKSDGTQYTASTSTATNGTTITAAPIINFNSGAAISNAGTLEFVATAKDLTNNSQNDNNEIVEINLENGSTITNDEGAAIIVGKGNQLNFNGGDIVNTNGTLTIAQGAIAKVNEVAEQDTSDQIISDGITNLDGTVIVDGRIEVMPDATLALASGTVLTTAAGTSGATTSNGNGIIVLSGSIANNLHQPARLTVTEGTLSAFLKDGDLINGQKDKAGAVVLNEAVVDFGESINLNNLKFADSKASTTDFVSGRISTTGQSTITANTITLTDVLDVDKTTAASADQKINANLTLETDNFKINALKTQATNISNTTNKGKLGFKEAIVHSNLDVQYVGTSNLLMADKYYLDAYAQSTDSNEYVAANGTITGDAFTVANGGSLNFRAGNWAAQQAITLDADTTANSGGSITVTTSIGSSEIFTDNQKTGASDEILLSSTNVTLNGLVFDVGESSAVSGNPSVTVSNSEAAADAGLTATLDLTSGISVVNANATNKGTGEIIVSGDGATILLNGNDVTRILADGGNNSNLHYVGLAAYNGGILDVNSAVSANYIDFVSGNGSTIASGDVTFSGGGVFVAPSLTLTGDASTDGTNTTVNIGSGNTIAVDALALNETNANAVTGDTQTILQSGNLEVAQSFTAQSDILNVSGAHVSLDTGDAATTGSLAIKDLLITGGSFNVNQGTWNSYTSDVTVNGGKLTVGDDADSEGATFAANLLKVGGEANSSVYVDDLGTASFVAADLSAATTGAITVSGKMTIEGAELDMDGDKTTGENHHGLYFGTKGNAGIFDVDGGTLTFGAEATKTFYNADAKVQESGAAVNDESGNLAYRLPYVEESSQDKLSVQNGGTVALTFADGTSFNGAQILSLKEQLFAEIADGAGATKLDGFLNIGDATITGINVVSGSIAWSELEPYTDIVWDTTNTELGTAKVTGVTQTSQIGGSYGSLEAVNGTDQVTIASNTELSNAAGNQGNFIGTADGTTIGAHVAADQILLLNGTGNVGAINLANNNDPNDATEVVFNATASGDAITVTGNVTGALTSKR